MRGGRSEARVVSKSTYNAHASARRGPIGSFADFLAEQEHLARGPGVESSTGGISGSTSAHDLRDLSPPAPGTELLGPASGSSPKRRRFSGPASPPHQTANAATNFEDTYVGENNGPSVTPNDISDDLGSNRAPLFGDGALNGLQSAGYNDEHVCRREYPIKALNIYD